MANDKKKVRAVLDKVKAELYLGTDRAHVLRDCVLQRRDFRSVAHARTRSARRCRCQPRYPSITSFCFARLK